MATSTDVFGNFPEFTRLGLEHKEAYEALISSLPPVDDLSFCGLMTWWNPLDNISVAILNDNLVVPYWMAGDEKHSGLSLIGTNNIDESFCRLFDYQRQRLEKPRLVNVPEFVLSHVRFPELFTFREEKRYAEYILPVSRFYPLKNMPLYWRSKVERSHKKYCDAIVVRALDLGVEENCRRIIHAAERWQGKGINNLGKVELDSIRGYIYAAADLDIENICLFIDGRLVGFCLYHVPSHDKRYISIKHIKATDKATLGFELIAHEFTKYLSERGAVYININTDQGLLRLRMFMLALGPINYFRKYSVEPAE